MKKYKIISIFVLSLIFVIIAMAYNNVEQFCENGIKFSNIEIFESGGELLVSYDKEICEYGCDDIACKVCIDTTWEPDISTICSSIEFQQTSNCRNTRTTIGTKQPECPDASNVLCGQQIISSNECEGCIGTGTYCREGVCQNGECYIECIDRTWTPDTSEYCKNVRFTQISNCGNTRYASGTKQPICADPSITPCGEIVQSRNECKCTDIGTYCREGVCQNGECYIEQKKYSFEYPEDKKSGYYVVACNRIPYNKLEHCNECMGDTRCRGYNDVRNLYTINEGYIEDFTYQADYPIYGAWEMQEHTDFTGKCFVGDCNRANVRNVVCIDEQGNLETETFDCDKWVTTYGYRSMQFCINGNAYLMNNGLHEIGTCQKPTIVNFYYIWNNNIDYEGYSVDWKARWEEHFEELRQEMLQYNINLQANFYEYQLPDDTYIPAIYPKVDEQHLAFNNNGDVHITIKAGKDFSMNYGYPCTTRYGDNPCEASSTNYIIDTSIIKIPDYYDTYRNQGLYALIHEFGHVLGCPHTGERGSLAAQLYMGDWMSYGKIENMFKYECRLGAWYYGQN